jgi:hypothetical protein
VVERELECIAHVAAGRGGAAAQCGHEADLDFPPLRDGAVCGDREHDRSEKNWLEH